MTNHKRQPHPLEDDIPTLTHAYRTFVSLSLSGLIGLSAYFGNDISQRLKNIESRQFENASRIADLTARVASLERTIDRTRAPTP